MARQHGVVSGRQLQELGLTPAAIKHRVTRGRLSLIKPGVYAVRGPALTDQARWMAAVLTCGTDAALSHFSAAQLWGLMRPSGGGVHVTVPARVKLVRRGIRIHRTRRLILPSSPDFRTRDRIPVTSPVRTLLDLAAIAQESRLERLVNEADKLGLVSPPDLRREIEHRRGERGVRALRILLDRDAFRITDSELERKFLRLVRKAGLPQPETQVRVNGFVVDFFWPEHGLVVETDGLRYHRTAAQQARDLERDQAHVLAGYIPLRFTHAQVACEPSRVARALASVLAGQLAGGGGSARPRLAVRRRAPG